MACPCKPFFISGSRTIHMSKTTCFNGNRYNIRSFSIPAYLFLLPKSELWGSSTMLNTPAIPKALLSTITRSTTSLLVQTSRGRASPFHFVFENSDNDNSNYGGWNDNNNNNGNNNKNNSSHDPWWWDDDTNASGHFSACLSLLCCFVVLLGIIHLQLASSALAKSIGNAVITEEMEDINVSEVKGSNWIKLIPDFVKDEFLVAPSTVFSTSSSLSIEKLMFMSWSQCKALLINLLLPEGFPDSVTSDYLEYSLWRGVQGIASQMSGVLATQALLYAVGLGKGAIPTAAAINWVLKDGIGYLSKIMLSKYGRHFDVHPKGWRLFADLLENSAFGLEMLTPVCPHLFLLIGAVAGSARSAATLIQAATRSCFYAGFAAQRNFAEVIAKGEAQGMLSKFVGIFFGITLANCVCSSTPHALASFCVIMVIHMFCNLKSYQSIQLRTLNPYRASLVFTEYLLTGQAPPIKEVNDEEPLFPAFPYLNIITGKKATWAELSSEAREAAVEIERRLELGSKLSSLVHNKIDALALFHLYKDENYILTEHIGKFCVVLKENSSAQDMLKSLFQVNYLYWLERNVGIEGRNIAADCKPGGKLKISLEYVQREFEHVKNDSEAMGWIVDGLISRPLPNKICRDASTAM